MMGGVGTPPKRGAAFSGKAPAGTAGKKAPPRQPPRTPADRDPAVQSALAAITRVLSQERVLTGRDWREVCRLLRPLIPGEWFAVAAIYQGAYAFPLIYTQGIERQHLDRLLRIFKSSADLLLPLVHASGNPVRLCDFLALATSSPDGYFLFEQTRYYQEAMAPAGVYYLCRVPLALDGQAVGELKLTRAKKWGEYTDREVGIASALQPAFSRAVARSLFHRLGRNPLLRWESEFSARGLTPREAQAAYLVLAGKSNLELAAELGLSLHTVKEHLKHVFRKLRIRQRSQIGSLGLGLGPRPEP